MQSVMPRIRLHRNYIYIEYLKKNVYLFTVHALMTNDLHTKDISIYRVASVLKTDTSSIIHKKYLSYYRLNLLNYIIINKTEIHLTKCNNFIRQN